jgi:flagellar hook-associated protein 1
MSLFGSIQMAGNTLRANDIALQVVGQNIANANTPGYLREEVVLTPAATQRMGGLLLGLGVEVEAVIQKVDKFLEERLRGAISDESSANVQREAYAQLEGLVGELGDSDLSTSMNNFFNSISEILNQPNDASVRNLAMLQGKTLTQNISLMSDRVQELRSNINDRVRNMSVSINQLTESISDLNIKIAQMQGGDTSKSDAVGLTDQRANSLEALSKLIGISSIEQTDGTVTVYCGGDYLVFGGTYRQVETVLNNDNGVSSIEIQIKDSSSKLDSSSGELYGLYYARDNVLTGYLDQLDNFARTLAFEFNKVYSSGQGLSGYSTLTSVYNVDDKTKPLDEAGLTYTPQNGMFQVLVRNTKTGLVKSTDVRVDLNGMGHETTLEDLTAALNGINGIQAEILVGGQLKISSTSSDNEFAFSGDTSGALAALGLNVFFTGTSAASLGVSEVVQADATKFAASRGGIGADTDNAEIMAQFLTYPLQSQNGQTLNVLYNNMMADVAQGSAMATTIADGADAFEATLRGQKMSISGVNLDEEAINMITYQRSYQASAKFIATVTGLLELLVTI